LLERDAARGELRARERRPRLERCLLDAGRPLPTPAPEPVVPRRGGRHGGPLGRRLPPPRRDSARARLVPAGRLPAEQAPLQPARDTGVRGLAPPPGRALRRPDEGAGRLQRPRRGTSSSEWALASTARLLVARAHGLRGAARAAVDVRARARGGLCGTAGADG